MNTIPPISTLGLFETHVPVKHLETSIAFYGEKLGLKLAHRVEHRNVAFFYVNSETHSMIGLWETGSAPLSMTLHFALKVSHDSILSACARLKALNITPLDFHGNPTLEPSVIGWMPAASVYFKDPDQHSLEYICPLAAPPKPAFGVQPFSDWQDAQE